MNLEATMEPYHEALLLLDYIRGSPPCSFAGHVEGLEVEMLGGCNG